MRMMCCGLTIPCCRRAPQTAKGMKPREELSRRVGLFSDCAVATLPCQRVDEIKGRLVIWYNMSLENHSLLPSCTASAHLGFWTSSLLDSPGVGRPWGVMGWLRLVGSLKL